MKMPTLTNIDMSRDFISAFAGYNHNLHINDAEFYDMKNMTSDFYPILSPRETRKEYVFPMSNPSLNGVISKDSLCYVDKGTFYINDIPVENFTLTDTPKQLVSMGAKVIIMPDKKYINTINLEDKGDLEASYTSTGTVSYTLCKNDGTAYESPVVSATAPDTTKLWIDTSNTPHTLKQFNTSTSMWVQIATVYVRIESEGIGASFNQGDGITISGVTPEQLNDLNNTMILQDKGDNYLVVVGILDTATTQDTPITIERRMPNLDYIIESQNRLWGCRYGTAVNGETVNEIYASKLGDPKNWNCFQGVTTDSYVVSCGTDGAFTGAVTYGGYPLFFKEDCLHKIYGEYPSNYRVQTTQCRGVESGSSKSLAIVNETLFYKNRDGICAYEGSLPLSVSSQFGTVKYKNAVGGASENKYFVSMQDMSNQWHLFAYDVINNMWHKEDDLHVVDFCKHDGIVYASTKTDMQIFNQPSDEVVEWMAETGDMGISMIDQKYISRLVVRLSLEIGSVIHVFIEYNSSGQWEHGFTANGNKLTSFDVSIRPMRCDHFKLRFVGKGKAKIYSISKIIEQGSDVYA